ncbi:DUF6221 family protein [Streptomyces sp. NPDC006640]|uniref:DUF6221 family protein n=1 Tax=Streptomyces sp. NPDC006640 TaxID=3364754 RepID=UPI00369D3045
MTEIADFLRARIVERRALAEAAAEDAGLKWSPGNETFGSSVNEADSGAAVVVGPWDYLDWDVRRHIAANAPAAVIADLDAKLRILDGVVPEIDAMEDQIDAEWGAGDPSERESMTLLRILARPFAEHPSYRKEDWAP